MALITDADRETQIAGGLDASDDDHAVIRRNGQMAGLTGILAQLLHQRQGAEQQVLVGAARDTE